MRGHDALELIQKPEFRIVAWDVLDLQGWVLPGLVIEELPHLREPVQSSSVARDNFRPHRAVVLTPAAVVGDHEGWQGKGKHDERDDGGFHHSDISVFPSLSVSYPHLRGKRGEE